MSTMSLIKGQICATTSPEWVQYCLSNRWTIGGIVEGMVPSNQNEFLVSMLLPPFQSISMILDHNDYASARGIYLQYLNNRQDTEPALCQILTQVVCIPGNVLLYAEREPNENFRILDTIAEFFATTFGVRIGLFADGSEPIPQQLNPTPLTNFNIADILFRNGFISKESYSMMMPEDAIPSVRSCGMLLQSINYGFSNPDEYRMACRNMLNTIKQQQITGKVSPMIAVK